MTRTAASIVRVLRLRDGGVEGSESSEWSDEWKVLVYDSATRAVISPLLTISELRALGVTLHMALDAPRDTIPDVSAVYFVAPTPVNVRALIDDAAAGRYRDAYVHFMTPCGRPALEALARGCVDAGAVPRIRRVVDEYLAFSALEDRLFTLVGMGNSYAAYAAPGLSEAEAERIAQTIASGLLAVCATSSIVPLIVAARGGPAELVARALEVSLRDHLAGTGGTGAVFSATGGINDSAPVLPGGRRPIPLGLGPGSRPVLLLLDRGSDLATPLLHASTYQSLVEDTLGPTSGNRVVVPETASSTVGGAAAADALRDSGGGTWLDAVGANSGGSGGGGGGGWADWAASAAAAATGGRRPGVVAAGKAYTLDAEHDAFWRAHASAPFPAAIEAHERELAAVVDREAEIRRRAGGVSAADEAAAVAAAASTVADSGSGSELVSAIDSLPALLRRKRLLETHSTLLHAVMDRVAARTVPHFFEAEVAAAAAAGGAGGWSVSDRAALLAMLADGAKGGFVDRLRLAVVYLLAVDVAGGSNALGEEAEAVLTALSSSIRRQNVGDGAGAAVTNTAAGGNTSVPAAAGAHLDRAAAVISYVRQMRALTSLSASAGSGGGGAAAGGGLSRGLGAAMSGLGLSALGATASSLLNIAAARVSRLVTSGDARLPVTRLLQAVCEGKPGTAPGVDAFLVLDARASAAARERTFAAYAAAASAAATGSASGSVVAGAPSTNSIFRNAFVFTVGGGSYAEYHDVCAYAASATPPRTVVYGATEMLSAPGLLAQLAQLGRAPTGGGGGVRAAN